MKKVISVFLSVLFSFSLKAQDSTSDALAHIQAFIQNVKENNVEAIAQNVAYPLKRAYPLSDIHNKTEFIHQYPHIFDANLQHRIVNSDPKKDWKSVGYRGFMLDRGILWLTVDGLTLKAINYQSDFEQKEKEKIIAQQKAGLFPSLQHFKSPVAFITTKNFKIRIDKLSNGKYRYASWAKTKSTAEKPDLILQNSIVKFEGSGGNHEYIFTNGVYTYVCYISIVGPEGMAPATLRVKKRGKEIIHQDAIQYQGE